MTEIFRKNSLKILSIIASLSLFFTPLLFSTEISNSARELSLKDSINISFLNNKTIQIQEEGLDIAKAGILGAKSAFWPKLSATYGYTLNGADLDFRQLALQGGGSKKDPGIFTGYLNDNRVGLSVDESVYNGGADIAVLKESRLDLKVQEETLRARKLDVAFEAKR